MISKITLLVLCLTCAFLSLAKGGNSDWARAVATTLVIPLFLLNWGNIYRDHKNRTQSIGPWLGLWGAVTAVITLQLIPGLGYLIGTPSVGCYEWFDCTNRPITSFPMATLSHWSMFTVYWVVAWLASRMSSNEVKIFAFVIVSLGAFQVIYGLLAFSAGQETILGLWKKEYYLKYITGTFVNRNHFAGFLELTWPLLLSVIMLPAHSGGINISIGWRFAAALTFSNLYIFAILGSQSRLGAASAFIGVVCWMLLMKKRQAKNNTKPVKWIGALALTYVVLSILWFGADGIVSRFINSGLTGRAVVWESMLELPLSVWLTGIGAGSFTDFFRTIQPPQLEFHFQFAHNDILEFVLDYGIIGTAFILLFGIRWLIYQFPQKPSRLQIGTICGVLAILIHSLGDFNLHIPGVAIVFWAFLGISMSNKRGKH